LPVTYRYVEVMTMVAPVTPCTVSGMLKNRAERNTRIPVVQAVQKEKKEREWI
jgi:hypothetical protein